MNPPAGLHQHSGPAHAYPTQHSTRGADFTPNSGPRQRVEAVDAATTDAVDATGTINSASFVTHAFVPDPLIQVVHPGPIRVTVTVERVTGSTPGSSH